MHLHKNASAKKKKYFGKFSIKFYGQLSLLVSVANSSYLNMSEI